MSDRPDQRPIAECTDEELLTELGSRVRPRPGVVTIADVLREVSAHFSVRLRDLIRPRRYASIAFPRHVAMYLARELTGASFPMLGRHFGGRDHTTAIHGCRVIERRMRDDGRTAQIVIDLRAKLAKETST